MIEFDSLLLNRLLFFIISIFFGRLSYSTVCTTAESNRYDSSLCTSDKIYDVLCFVFVFKTDFPLDVRIDFAYLPKKSGRMRKWRGGRRRECESFVGMLRWEYGHRCKSLSPVKCHWIGFMMCVPAIVLWYCCCCLRWCWWMINIHRPQLCFFSHSFHSFPLLRTFGFSAVIFRKTRVSYNRIMHSLRLLNVCIVYACFVYCDGHTTYDYGFA